MASRELNDFIAACRARRGTSVSNEPREATSRFLAAARSSPTLLREAAATLDELPVAGAAWLAVTLGSSIEGGNDPELSGPPLFNYFRRQLALFPQPPLEDPPDGSSQTYPQQDALIAAFLPICQAVVAHLGRLPERRAILASDQARLARLEQLQAFGWGAVWVREALLKVSGTLVALHPPSGAGVRLQYRNVSNCFHLFSLIQVAIGQRIVGGRAASQAVAAAARGTSGEPTNDQAWWHYGDPRSREPALGASIWGEGLVRGIPFVGDVQVVLLWPPILSSRGWDSGFFGPQLAAMPPDALLERALSEHEARALMQRLGIEERLAT